MKVDELLANIRKSVDSDIDSLSGGTPTQSRGTLMRGALREMRISMETDGDTSATVKEEISDLRSRIKKKMEAMETAPLQQPTGLRRPDLRRRSFRRAAIFPVSCLAHVPRDTGLRPSYAEQNIREDLRYAPSRRMQRSGRNLSRGMSMPNQTPIISQIHTPARLWLRRTGLRTAALPTTAGVAAGFSTNRGPCRNGFPPIERCYHGACHR